MTFLPKDYVTVSNRLEKFHDKYPKGSIETGFSIEGDVVMFSCKVSDGESRTFTGHSFGRIGKEKAFEKLETVSVGRALAFMGFETQSGIASREEMEVFEEKDEDRLEITDFIQMMKDTDDLNDLKRIFEEAYAMFKSEKQRKWLTEEKDRAKSKLMGNDYLEVNMSTTL